jgi:hypothetical protein
MAGAAKRAFITVNGEAMEIVAGSARLTPGGISKTAVVADSGRVFSSGEPKAGGCAFTLIMTDGNPYESTLRNLADGTIVFQWDTGVVYTLTAAEPDDAASWEWAPDGLPCKFFSNEAKPS